MEFEFSITKSGAKKKAASAVTAPTATPKLLAANTVLLFQLAESARTTLGPDTPMEPTAVNDTVTVQLGRNVAIFATASGVEKGVEFYAALYFGEGGQATSAPLVVEVEYNLHSNFEPLLRRLLTLWNLTQQLREVNPGIVVQRLNILWHNTTCLPVLTLRGNDVDFTLRVEGSKDERVSLRSGTDVIPGKLQNGVFPWTNDELSGVLDRLTTE